MANHARGTVDLMIGGRAYAVAMTLGALAEVTSALGIESMKDFEQRLLDCRPGDIKPVIIAVLKGNGHDVPAEHVDAMDWRVYFTTLLPAFFRTDGDAKPADGEARPPKRQKA